MSEQQHRRVQIGSAIYTVVPIAIALSPIKTGPLTLGPVTASVVVELPGNNNRRRDPFSLFGNVERRQVSLVAEEQTLQCLALPKANQPADFTGAVGNFTMTVNIGPTNVATGDPITVRVQINGQGALDGLTLPEQTAWGNFKTYPPTAKVETSDPLGLQGTKTFEEVISPENADIQELPPFTFSFFDPETKTYRTLTHPATKLTVHPGGNVVAPTIAATTKTSSSDAAPAQVDIVPIKQRLGAVASRDRATGFTSTYIALNLAPALALVGFVVWRKRSDALVNNPRLRRQRTVAAMLQAGLDRLRNHATQNQSDAFFAELMRLLQEKLGAQLDLPATAITEAVIDDKLRPRGVPDSTLEAVHELFQATNLARYAPLRSSQELAAYIPKLEHALRKLDEVKA
ncbi:MAG: BatD family protein [Verrucomicrobiota bacterium]